MKTKSLTLHHLGDRRFRAENPAGVTLEFGGVAPGAGLRPMEMLLSALASCTAWDVLDIMEKKRQPLVRYRVEASGEQADEHPKRYVRYTLVHVASGPGVTEAALHRAAELSHGKYCSVSASLDAPVDWRVVVEPWEE
ncbi:MAG: OsmC family protein [Deltaproteobacteria bacterium]|nr:OsmC family protein [Deltaproteobacteria bacterium]